MGESSQYSSHKHTWKVVDEVATFRCNLCGVTGSGFRYQCKPCNFNLHPYCVTCHPTLTSPINPQHQFKLVNAKTMPATTYRCKTCSDEIQGIFYHLGHGYDDYHPLCAPLITVQPQSNPQPSLDTQSRSLYCHHPYPHQVYAPYPVPHYVQTYVPTSTTYIANRPHYYYPSYGPNNCVTYVANRPSYPPNYGPHMYGVHPHGQVPNTSNVGNCNQGQGNNFCLGEEELEWSSSEISNFVQGFLGGAKILHTVMTFFM